jgi:acyl carrier protein
MDFENEIMETVKSVLSVRRKHVTIDIDTPLTGTELGVAADELVYIVLELMEKYHIAFDATDFENYGFNTVRGIIRAVMRYVNP